MFGFMLSDQCGFPGFCCEKSLEEQAESLEYSGVEEEREDDNFGQVSGCSYCSYGQASVYEKSISLIALFRGKPTFIIP